MGNKNFEPGENFELAQFKIFYKKATSQELRPTGWEGTYWLKDKIQLTPLVESREFYVELKDGHSVLAVWIFDYGDLCNFCKGLWAGDEVQYQKNYGGGFLKMEIHEPMIFEILKID